MNYRITGTGSCTPDITKKNSDFLQNKFLDRDGIDIQSSNSEIIEKFKSITGIYQRRYASDEINSSDLATVAAKGAICLLYTSPSPRDLSTSRMPSSA